MINISQEFSVERFNRNLELGREAIEFARQKIIYTNTFPHLHYNEIKKMGKIVTDFRERVFSEDESLKELLLIPSNKEIRIIKRTVRGVKINPAGNCNEYANLVVNYLRKHNCPSIRVFIEEGNHVFVLIDPEGEIKYPSTWGEHSVICDAWANKCYKAKDIFANMEWLDTFRCWSI